MPEKGGVETLEKVPGAFCKWNSERTNKQVNGCMSPISFISPPKLYKFFAPWTFLNYEGFMKSYE